MNFNICVTAKNEENTIPRMMKSLEEYTKRGGKVFLLDTGSTDDTVKIARSLGCIVTEVGAKFITTIDDSWAKKLNKRFVVKGEPEIVESGKTLFDFASARNHIASLAEQDMICTLDCDEAYSVFKIDAINELIEKGYEQFEYSFVFAHDAWGKPAIEFIQSKFYNRKKMEWRGIVHEVLAPINNSESKRVLLTKKIILLEHWQEPAKDHRSNYLAGLALDCYQHQKNDRNSHYLARELLWTNRPKSAIKEFERHIKMNRWPTERSQSMIFTGDAYGILGDPEKQVEWYSHAYMIDPNRREALIKLAAFYQKNNIPKATAAYAKAALELVWTDYYANQKIHYEAYPHELLYWAYGWLGNIPEARKHILKALEYQPYNQKLLDETKFYFDYHNMIDGWMHFNELLWLNDRAKEMRSVCEIGSWKGRSTHALLSGCKGEVTAVDNFEGAQDKRDKSHYLVKEENIIEVFKKNVGHFKNLKIIKGDSVKTAKDIPDKSFDMVFIDAGHSYEEVKADIRAWGSKARVLLCGHDYIGEWPEVMKAVDEEIGLLSGIGGNSIWYKYLVPKVSFIIPQLGRPDGLKKCIDSIKALRYPQELIDIKIIEGPATVPCKVKMGVEATSGEYIAYASNDCQFEPDSLITAIEESRESGKRLVAFDTGVRNEFGYINEHFLIKRDLLPLIGDIFDTDFYHFGCDDLLWRKCEKLGEAMLSKGKVMHNHYSRIGSGIEMDEVNRKGMLKEKEDRKLLKEKLAKL